MTTFVVVISTLNLLLGYALAVACQRMSQPGGVASRTGSLEPPAQDAPPIAAVHCESPAEAPAPESEATAEADGGLDQRARGMAPLLERLPGSLPGMRATASVEPVDAIVPVADAGAAASDDLRIDVQRFREELAELGRELHGSLVSEADGERKERLKQFTEERAGAEASD